MTNRSDFINRFRKTKSTTNDSVSSSGSSSTSGNSNNRGISANRGIPQLWRRNKERSSSLSTHEDAPANCRCKELYSSHLSQDIVTMKTYLHRLRRILQEADTSPPTINAKSVQEELEQTQQHLTKNNQDEEVNDLKRQLVYLQQQNEDKDRTIRSLQRQLECQPSPVARSPSPKDLSNTATQTERPARPISCGIALSSYSTDASSNHSSSSSGHSSEPRNPDGRKLRRSRTPLPRRVFLCSDDGTLRIPIKH